MNTKYRLLFVIVILTITALACGQLNIGIEDPSQDTSDLVINNPETPEPETETQTEPESNNTAVKDDIEKENFSQYWTEVEDTRTGLRFALPCFWVADIPTGDTPGGLGGFSVNNFTQDFITSLGNKRSQTVFEIGGLKFDLSYQTMADYNLGANASLEELAYAIVNPDQEHGISSTLPIEINGKQALQVNTYSVFGEGRFYLLPFINDLIILFAPGPAESADHPDLQAILNSMTLDPAQSVQLPNIPPANPPEGMAAACMGQIQPTQSISPANSFAGTLDCSQVSDAEELKWIMCNVQDSFISRNTQPLLGYMGDIFRIGYWQSEGVEYTKDEAMVAIETSLIPNNPGGMAFTQDETFFPPLFGMKPEQIFPPDANIVEVVYSEGWGQEGLGGALLYFAEKPNGEYYFYGMIVAQQHFDK